MSRPSEHNKTFKKSSKMKPQPPQTPNPSSLDYRSTELTVSSKKVVVCRGGSRYVERCWGFPYLKIQKLPICHFMFLVDLKFISKILKNCLRGSSSLFGVRLRLFNFSKLQKSKCRRIKQNKTNFEVSKASKLHISISKISFLSSLNLLKHMEVT